MKKSCFKGRICSKAFTLIELLVVVLIIGILAAVAVPQYKKAVAKVHTVEAITLLEALVQAEDIYYLANNSYTDDFSLLDVSIDENLHLVTGTPENKNQYYFHCQDLRSCFAWAANPDLPIFEFVIDKDRGPSRNRLCIALDKMGHTQLAKDVCKSLGTEDPERAGYFIMNSQG